MIFTRYRQPLFFYLHDIYRISTAPLFNLHGIYKVSTAPLFQFTWYLQDLNSPLFSIYVVFTMFFTGSRQPPFFNLHGIYNVIYRILAATLFQFTWSLQDLGRLPLINLHVIYMICVLLPNNIYSIFLYIYMFQCRNLHVIYSIF